MKFDFSNKYSSLGVSASLMVSVSDVSTGGTGSIISISSNILRADTSIPSKCLGYFYT